MNRTKKICRIAERVIMIALIVFSAFMMIFTVVTVATVDKNDRSVFGIKFYIVQTDSMSLSDRNRDMDVHFDAGDIVMIKRVEDPTGLQAGDVIAFMSTNSISYGETVTHMIKEAKTNAAGDLVGYVTYGTNTGNEDEAIVEPEYVLGRYTGKLIGVGRFFAYLKSTRGYVVCILVPFLLLISYNAFNVIKLFRKYKGEQMAAMQAEREELVQERAENQRMMAELLALKEQLSKNGNDHVPLDPASGVPGADGGAEAADVLLDV